MRCCRSKKASYLAAIVFWSWVANASGQNSQIQEKRVSGSRNTHFPSPQKRALWVKKIPIFLVKPFREMGIFWLKAPFSGALRNRSFLTPKPSFPDFGDFDACRKRTRFFKSWGCLGTCASPREPQDQNYPEKKWSSPDLFSPGLFPICPLCWPPLFLSFCWHLFALFFPLKVSLLQSEARSAERGGRQSHDGPLHRVRGGNSFPNLRENRSEPKR